MQTSPETEGRPLRLAVRVVLLFLLAVVLGRLMLEPTGTGMVVALIVTPLLGVALVAWQGLRGGVMLLLFVAVMLLARLLFATSESAWVGVLLLPVVLACTLILVSVGRRLMARRAG